jgi:hypothetical protein
MTQLAELTRATREDVAFVGERDRVVLAKADLDYFFFVIFRIKIVLDEGLYKKRRCLALDTAVAQLAECCITETVKSATLEKDHRMVPASTQLHNTVFWIY